MKFLCLCAVHNHHQSWLENLVQCFLDQTHREATLLILDDRPKEFRYPDPCNFIPWSVPNVAYAITTNRKNMAQKYNDGLKLAVDIPYDCVSIWDDDDFFLPDHLERHAEVLKDHAWSVPENVLSLYQDSVIQLQPNGLYWSSYAFRKDVFSDGRDFGNFGGLGFDQEFVKRVRSTHGEPGVVRGKPTYIYNWSGTTEHLSITAKSYDDTTWPERVKPAKATGVLEPARHPVMSWAVREAAAYL